MFVDEESELGLNELKHEVSIHKHIARIVSFSRHYVIYIFAKLVLFFIYSQTILNILMF